jgi:hypothetical protein
MAARSLEESREKASRILVRRLTGTKVSVTREMLPHPERASSGVVILYFLIIYKYRRSIFPWNSFEEERMTVD